MQTTTSIKAGNAPDLLSGILSVQVRNEEKITEQDRLYCQSQQDLLYKTLNQIEKWYAIFKEDAEQYRKERQFKYEDNGKVSIRDFYFHNGQDDYSHNEFKPFNLINDLVDKSHNANANFANRIIPISTRPTMWMSLSRKLTDRHCLWDSDRSTRPMWILSSNIWAERVSGKLPRRNCWPVS